jgi:hypothetical protein
MNEKIRELAMKAGFCEESSLGIMSPYIEDSDISELLEDFANLIVKECLSNMNNCNCAGDLDFAIWKTVNDFGVEQ